MPVETSRGPRSHRATSEASSNPSNAGMLPSSLSHSPPVSGPGMSQGTMSITSIIEHPSGTTFPRSAHTMGEFSQHMAIASHPRSFHPEYMYGAMGSADSPMYSSDSCYSPMSDYPGPQIASQSFGHHEGMIPRPPSTFSEPSLQPNPIASPLSVGPSFPPMWSSIDATSGLDASYHPTVGIQRLDHPSNCANTKNKTESNVHLPLSNIHSKCQHSLRHESITPPSGLVQQSGLLKIRDPKTRHYIDCYWQCFYPICPIVHKASFLTTIPDSFLAASMVMIGAQFSPRPDAKQDSAVLYSRCLNFVLPVSISRSHCPLSATDLQLQDSITSRSPVCDLQTIIHLEFFSRYRARPAKLENIQSSISFRNLYSNVGPLTPPFGSMSALILCSS